MDGVASTDSSASAACSGPAVQNQLLRPSNLSGYGWVLWDHVQHHLCDFSRKINTCLPRKADIYQLLQDCPLLIWMLWMTSKLLLQDISNMIATRKQTISKSLKDKGKPPRQRCWGRFEALCPTAHSSEKAATSSWSVPSQEPSCQRTRDNKRINTASNKQCDLCSYASFFTGMLAYWI